MDRTAKKRPHLVRHLVVNCARKAGEQKPASVLRAQRPPPLAARLDPSNTANADNEGRPRAVSAAAAQTRAPSPTKRVTSWRLSAAHCRQHALRLQWRRAYVARGQAHGCAGASSSRERGRLVATGSCRKRAVAMPTPNIIASQRSDAHPALSLHTQRATLRTRGLAERADRRLE